MFGATRITPGVGFSNTGHPRLYIRLIVSLLYLKHAFNESDADVLQRWDETHSWKYFFGQEYFEHRLPYDPILLFKLHKLLGEEGVEELLARNIEVAVTLKLIAKKELSRITVDSTVQEKAIAHPTDCKLLDTARVKMVEAAKARGIELKQTYSKEGLLLGYKAGRCAHARQFKRMRNVLKCQSTRVGRLQREITRKINPLSQAVQEALVHKLQKAKHLNTQTSSNKSKTKDNQPKLYSWHSPEVKYIFKAKSRNPYEFGVKVGIATMLNGTPIVGAISFTGNPHDGHTLNEQVEQKRKLLKRRQAIEQIIGHLKTDLRMNRCHLKAQRETICMRCWLQHLVVAENDRKERLWAFFRWLNAFGFENLKRKLHQILAMNLSICQSLSGVVI
jgi:IS5 family transposase